MVLAKRFVVEALLEAKKFVVEAEPTTFKLPPKRPEPWTEN